MHYPSSLFPTSSTASRARALRCSRSSLLCSPLHMKETAHEKASCTWKSEAPSPLPKNMSTLCFSPAPESFHCQPLVRQGPGSLQSQMASKDLPEQNSVETQQVDFESVQGSHPREPLSMLPLCVLSTPCEKSAAPRLRSVETRLASRLVLVVTIIRLLPFPFL